MAFAFNEFLDEFDGFGGDFGCAKNALGFATAANFEDIAFGFVEDGLDFVGSFVGSDDDLGTGLLEFAEKAFIADLAEVGGGSENADNASGEVADESGAACGVGEFAIVEPSEKGGGIDGLTGFVHLDDATKNDLVGGVEKIFFAEALFAGDIDDGFGIGEHGAEKGSFGLEIMVGGQALDGDGGRGFATSPRTSGLSFGNHREVYFLWAQERAMVGKKLLKNKLRKRWIRMNNSGIRSVRYGELGAGYKLMRILLASTSPRRADLLRESGVDFQVVKPEVAEWQAADFPEMAPGDLARGNAMLKAKEVAGRHAKKPVLAADTLVVCEGRVLGKPADEGSAKKMLGWLSGKTHEVITAVIFILPEGKKLREAVVRTRVKFRVLGEEDIAGYLKEVEVMDKAGAYALQDGGDRLVEWVEGSRSNVIGLPMETVLPWCEEWGEG